MSINKIEFSADISLKFAVILKQNQLSKLDEYKDSNFYHYMICRRNRITVDLENTFATNETISIWLHIHTKNSVVKKQYDFSHNMDTSDFEFISVYPYNGLTIKYQWEFYSNYESITYLLHSTWKTLEELDLELLYIWQSYWTNWNRTASERLRSHDTLQQIYNDVIEKSPESEVFIIACEFFFNQMIMLNPPRNGILPKNTNFNDDTLDSITDIPDSQLVTLIEAAMIKFFQPEYNKDYKKHFPKTTHSYERFYELEYNSVFIGLEIFKCIWARIYTWDINPQDIYSIKYHFESKWGSQSILSYLGLE